MRRLWVSALVSAAVLCGAASVQAAPEAIFSSSYYSSGNEVLSLATNNGPYTIDTNGFQGWVSTGAVEGPQIGGPDGNQNFYSGLGPRSVVLNNYFGFVVNTLPAGTVVYSATLSVPTYDVSDPTGNGFNYSLFDSTRLSGSLYDAASPNLSLAQAMQSGALLGTFAIGGTNGIQGYTVANFGLNSIGVTDLNYDISHGSQYFVISGSIDGLLAAPEPATWVTMLLGVAAVGANFRRRRGRAMSATV